MEGGYRKKWLYRKMAIERGGYTGRRYSYRSPYEERWLCQEVAIPECGYSEGGYTAR